MALSRRDPCSRWPGNGSGDRGAVDAGSPVAACRLETEARSTWDKRSPRCLQTCKGSARRQLKAVVPSSSLTRPGALGQELTPLPVSVVAAHRGCAPPGSSRPFGYPGERRVRRGSIPCVLTRRLVPPSEFSFCLQDGRQVHGYEGPHVGKHQDQVSPRAFWTSPREGQASPGTFAGRARLTHRPAWISPCGSERLVILGGAACVCCVPGLVSSSHVCLRCSHILPVKQVPAHRSHGPGAREMLTHLPVPWA